MTTCPSCGADNPVEAAYCARCGLRLPTLINSNSASLRNNGTRLETAPEPASLRRGGYERRVMTILFADIVSFSTLSEHIDPEELLEVMQGAYPCLLEPIQDHTGTVVQVMGDGVLAYFGSPSAREDDPENAILTGLDIVARIQTYARHLQQERGLEEFNVRVGINTGLVVVGEMVSEKHLEYTALGDAVNLAARLQQNAPPGGVLISHATFRHVAGLFDVLPQAPLTVKGRQQVERTYLVQQVKPAHLRLHRRGIAGIETRMIGREPEMAVLQNGCRDAFQGGETRLILVTGEAGLGKTRLLDEYALWVASQPTSPRIFQGRAGPDTQNVPYGAFRDLFSHGFEILENDNSAQALEKFRQKTREIMDSDQADLVGQLVGFDFSTSPAVHRLYASPSFAEMASLYLVNYFRRLAEKPLLVMLEDLHWMDDSSLDLIIELLTNLAREPETHLMIVCTARSQFFERRPKWGEGISGFNRLELSLLSRSSSRALIKEILSHVEDIPEALYDCVIEEAEGSPFFIEELIKMLIDEGVIATGAETWHVLLDRLAAVHVPPTLTGILQARLDGLPAAERLVLQRAAVIGRTFWDGLVRVLTEDETEARQVHIHLAALRERGMVFQRERSMIAGNQEYLFKHALVRDAAYETVLLKHRHIYHRKVAAWIETHAGERLEENLALVAGHYADGGQPDMAADWYIRAGKRALNQCSMQEARRLFERALALIRPDDLARRWRAVDGHDRAMATLGERAARQADIASLLDMATRLGDDDCLAESWYSCGSQAMDEGNNLEALHAFEQALLVARRAKNLSMQALILPLQVNCLTSEGDLQSAAVLVEQALEIANQSGNDEVRARALTNLAPYFLAIGDLARSLQLMQQQVEITRAQGNRLGEAVGLVNLGYSELSAGRFEAGRNMLEHAVQLSRSLKSRKSLSYGLLNLGLAEWRLGHPQSACQALEESLPNLEALGDKRGLAFRLFYLGLAREQAGLLTEATIQYEMACSAFKELGATTQMVESQAGVARLAFQSGDFPHARREALEVFTHLEQHGPQGFDLPVLVYLTCARVFQALSDTPRLQHTLEMGCRELQARLNRIADPAWRQIFLEAIPENRDLLAFKPAET